MKKQTYTLAFTEAELKAVNLLLFTLNHLNGLDMQLEDVEDGLSAVVEAAKEKAEMLSGRFYNAVWEEAA